jgi:hypothetical protein
MTSSNTLDSQISKEANSHYAALSVRQPWAYLIVMGQKTLELRSWSTSYRGLLLVHAPRRIDEKAMHYFDLQDSGLDTGCLIGAVELVDVIRMTPEELRLRRWEHRSFGVFSKGMYGLVLRPLRVFSEPIPILGSRGIFDIVDTDITSAIREQLEFEADIT